MKSPIFQLDFANLFLTQSIIPGGYDRGECLNTVEAFDLSSNTWTPMPSLLFPRGRFDASETCGKLFAVGGSNGHKELRTVECYSPESKQWSRIQDMASPRSSAGWNLISM